jgi:prevent-host-death family protein
MTTIGVRELARNASRVVDDVGRSRRPVIVTVHGKPVAAVIPLNEDELEDYVLAYGEEFIRDRLEAERDLVAGRTHALDDVLAELDD